MDEIKEKYLPVGTVVLLKNGKKRVMITGFCVQPQGKDEAYDYSGCLYPEGFLSSNQNCLFNHSQIEKVFHMGLIDDEEINFKKQLKSLIDMADQFSKFKTTDDNKSEDDSINNESADIDTLSEVDTTENTNNENISETFIEDDTVLNKEESTIPFNIASDSNNAETVETSNDKSENMEIETLDDFIS